jgi:hypothetical protein
VRKARKWAKDCGTFVPYPAAPTPFELVTISELPGDALREAHELARAGESGEPLRAALGFARGLRPPAVLATRPESDGKPRRPGSSHVGVVFLPFAFAR